MALTNDQRAMLRLLAQNEEGYEDIAALKGVSVEQVKAEVREALTAAAAEQEAEQREESAPPEPPPPAEPAPAPPPEPAAAQSPPPPPTKPKAPRKAGFSVPPERRRLLVLAGGALGIVAVVLILVAALGGGSGGSGSAAGSGTAGEPTSAENASLTQAVLQPVGGASGEGRAIFGRIGKEEIVLQVTARKLEPAQGGQSYTVWLYRSPQLALRVGAAKVSSSGRLGAQFPIPAELLAYVASGAFKQIYLSRTSDAAYEREVAQAKKQKKLPPYSGETVLKGNITGPIVKE